jgi:HSP20 family protein
MAISRYRPPTETFGRLFEDFFNPATGWEAPLAGMLRAPDADVVESEDEIRVAVELPGLKPEEFSVDLEGNVLTISGEKREEHERNDERNKWHVSERRYGKFSRSFVLPREVEQDRIEARYDNGVLYLAVPKSEKARRRRIEIQPGSGAHQVGAGKNDAA